MSDDINQQQADASGGEGDTDKLVSQKGRIRYWAFFYFSWPGKCSEPQEVVECLRGVMELMF